MKRSTGELGRYVRERQARIERLQAEVRGDFNESLARLYAQPDAAGQADGKHDR